MFAPSSNCRKEVKSGTMLVGYSAAVPFKRSRFATRGWKLGVTVKFYEVKFSVLAVGFFASVTLCRSLIKENQVTSIQVPIFFAHIIAFAGPNTQNTLYFALSDEDVFPNHNSLITTSLNIWH